LPLPTTLPHTAAPTLPRDAWDEIIERCEAVGVDAFEINFSCPHGMPERKMGMVREGGWMQCSGNPVLITCNSLIIAGVL
jgi:hypothetical protein